MEYIIKVNAQAIENKEKKTKFVVFNTYIKSENKDDLGNDKWVKFNVKFSKECKIAERTSYIYADGENISINEIGDYPTVFIKKVNKQKVIEFDKKDLAKFFKVANEGVEQAEKDLNNPLGEPVKEEDLPF